MISKAEFATNIPSSKDDFLSFIEKHEVMHQMSKEKRMNNKENSIASTNTGCTNSKISRPFSGDPKTQESKRKILPNGKNKTGVFRSRESSSANYKNKPERFLYNDNNTVTAAPTHIEEDKYLPDIEETLSKNSDTEYELSPDEGSVEKSLGKTNKNSTVGTNNNELSEIMNDRENHDSKVKNSQNKFQFDKSTSGKNILLESKDSNNARKEENRRLSEYHHESVKNESGTDLYNLIESLTIPKSSQINMGSPVHQIKHQFKIEKTKLNGMKRPSTADNRVHFNKQEELTSSLLASTVHISREKVKLNLANMMFSKPEVDSIRLPIDSRMSIKSRVSSANRFSKIELALVIVQKHLRGYITRARVQRMKDIKSLMDRRSAQRSLNRYSKVGQGLKISDLSVEPKPNYRNKDVIITNPMCYQGNESNEVTQDLGKSRFDHTQSILIDFLKKDNSRARKYESSKILNDMDDTRNEARKYDDRDLNNGEMMMFMQESPLKHELYEDDITIISTNTTMDIVSSSRKNKQRFREEASVNSLNRAPKNKMLIVKNYWEHTDRKEHKNINNEIILECEEEYEPKVSNQTTFKREIVSKPTNCKSQLSILKSSSSERQKR